MQKRYREMTPEELRSEMEALLQEQAQAKFPSQKDILEQKYYMAKAYTLDPEDFRPGPYTVIGWDGVFQLAYVNGIMAWGSLLDENGIEGEEASYPLSRLLRISVELS